jgi:hypothetical protein
MSAARVPVRPVHTFSHFEIEAHCIKNSSIVRHEIPLIVWR